MYSNKLDTEYRDEVRFTKKHIVWFVAFLLATSAIIWFATRTTQIADNAILHYEEFQEIYNTCAKINTDLATIREVPDDDRMFAAFSKAAMIAAKRQQMSRWVEEYNAKSKMWSRALWKAEALPYQLNVNDFNRYDK